MEYLLLLVGFLLLIKGADWFVDGASSIATSLKVPSIVIGLTLVSLGTSAPEAAVSITAGLSGNSDIALGNVIGSNIFNLLAVIGVSAMFRHISSPEPILKRDLPINIGITALLMFFMADGKISRINGLILFAGIIIYMIFLVKNAMKNRITETETVDIMPIPKSILFVIVGLAAVIVGGQLVVNNASSIARSLGMSNTLVGLTIVAIGTSLPELVTSVMAAKKGEIGIALGNAVGSCIFNVLFIIGITTAITPIATTAIMITDITISLVAIALTYIFAYHRRDFNSKDGILMIIIFIIYMAYIILRN